MPRPLNVINVQRTDTAWPKHDAKVVVRVSLPESFSLGGISDKSTRLVPPLTLGSFLTRLNRDQGQIKGIDVTFCPIGDGYSFGRFTHRRASRNP
ncbi:hypothetical protein D3C85_984820 [compost metagenome]